MELQTDKLDYGWAEPHPYSEQQRVSFEFKFYRSRGWERLRKAFLSKPKNTFCQVSLSAGRLDNSEVCDHVIRIRNEGAPRNPVNFMALSDRAHQVKRALESHGYFDNLRENVDFVIENNYRIPTEAFKAKVINELAKRLYGKQENPGTTENC